MRLIELDFRPTPEQRAILDRLLPDTRMNLVWRRVGVCVLRTRALPAFEMPSSTSISPVFHGLGPNPAYAATSLRLPKLR